MTHAFRFPKSSARKAFILIGACVSGSLYGAAASAQILKPATLPPPTHLPLKAASQSSASSSSSSSSSQGGIRSLTATATSAPASGGDIHITTGGNLRALANAAGYAGGANAHYTFYVDAGTTVFGLNTGTWPADADLTLIIKGNVFGHGGTGGNGGDGAQPTGSLGMGGTAALSIGAPIKVRLEPGGRLAGGGGGGGGGALTHNTLGMSYGGGAGGGGFPDGRGGNGGRGELGSGNNGMNGSAATGGTGGNGVQSSGRGGNGGNAGAAGGNGNGAGSRAGSAGGAAGPAIAQNGIKIDFVNDGGTLSGAVN